MYYFQQNVSYIINVLYTRHRASQVVLVVRNPPANARDVREVGLILELGRSPREGHGSLLQYSFLENPMDREAGRAYSPWVSKELEMT